MHEVQNQKLSDLKKEYINETSNTRRYKDMRLSFTGSKGNLYITVYLNKKDNVWISRKYIDEIRALPKIIKLKS